MPYMFSIDSIWRGSEHDAKNIGWTRDFRAQRELVRYRTSLVRERAAESNRVQTVLEGANVKLASVANRVLGLSGRAMVEAHSLAE